MCGLVGVIYGAKKRQAKDRTHLKWLFTHLLLLSERRGPYATGIAWVDSEGNHGIFKRPITARGFVKEKEFLDVISEVNDDTTWLAGHTRWPTRGDVNELANAQPIRAGSIVGTHNGTVLNADNLFKRFKLPRFAEVDSEIVFRMADAELDDGCIDITGFKKRLMLCQGQISAALISKLDPRRLIVVKGNKPLELRYHPDYQAIVYASDAAYLDAALQDEEGWKEVMTRPMSIMTFHCDDLMGFSSEPFRLAKQSGFHRFIAAESKKY